VETDGDSHDDPTRDRIRDQWFNDHGWFVLRFDDNDVFEELDEAIDLIIQAVDDPESVGDPLNVAD
jgi:very-short-patch-repair endonuclease